MEQHYRRVVEDTKNRVIAAMQRQIMNQKDARLGGFWEESGIVQAKYAIYQIAPMAAAYCCPDSIFYRNKEVCHRILLGLAYIRRVQHENGLFDFITCNFFSAPDTAFCLKKLLPVYEYLRGKTRENCEQEIFERLEEIIRDGANGMLLGGFHTPNHRWAIASILMACSKYFENEQMEKAAYQYLSEGIDCNGDGEYSEKSAGNYNRINNDAMLLLSEVTGDASYEQNAVRNLWMMINYIEPDNSIFTANSTRFDKDLLIYPTDYYMEYLRMGIKYNIPEFLGICNFIFDLVEEKRIVAPDCLIWFLLCKKYREFEFEGRYSFQDFHAFYRESKIARCRSGRYSYTVMSGKSNFFYLHNGTIKLEIKVCGSFCEHRAFKSEEMEQVSEKEYHLWQIMKGWYYLPFEEAQKTSDWWKMDHTARKKKQGPDMRVDVWVKEEENGVCLRIKTSGVSGAPWRIEMAFLGVNLLTSDQISLPLSGSEVLVVKEGDVAVTNGWDTLMIGPCFGAHHFIEGKEDSEKKTPGAFTLYLTDYTAFDREIHIQDKQSGMNF